MSDRDTGKTTSERQFERIAFLAPVIAGCFFLIIVALYSWNFWGGFGDQATFGAFGDFIGGVLNPFLTFLTVLLLIYSIRFQIDELRLTRHEMQKNTQEAKETKELQAENLANEKAMFDKKIKMHSETIKNQNRINAIEQIAIELDTIKANLIQLDKLEIIPASSGSAPILFDNIVSTPNKYLESIGPKEDPKNKLYAGRLSLGVARAKQQSSILIFIMKEVELQKINRKLLAARFNFFASYFFGITGFTELIDSNQIKDEVLKRHLANSIKESSDLIEMLLIDQY